jgi:hypothetical protein
VLVALVEAWTSRAPGKDAVLNQPGLESDPEEQDHYPHLGEHLQDLARLHQAEHRGAHHKTREDLADHRWLTDALEGLVADLGCKQDDEQVGDVLGDFGRGAEVNGGALPHRGEDFALDARVSASRGFPARPRRSRPQPGRR